jgi:hypothetical protein
VHGRVHHQQGQRLLFVALVLVVILFAAFSTHHETNLFVAREATSGPAQLFDIFVSVAQVACK